MKYRYTHDGKNIEYYVLTNKENLEIIHEKIKEKILAIPLYQSSEVINFYISLMDIIREIIDEKEEGLDKLFNFQSKLSFFDEEKNRIKQEILDIKKQLNKCISAESILNFKIDLLNKESMLSVYQLVGDRNKKDLETILTEIFTFIQLKRTNIKKRTKKYK